MSYKLPTKYLILAIGVLILAIFFGGWYIGSSKTKSALKPTIQTQKHEIEKMVIQLEDTEYYLTRTEQQLATERELRKKDVFEKEELKKTGLKQANEINRLKFRIDTLLEDVVHDGTVIEVLNSQLSSNVATKDTIKKQKAMLLPFNFEKTDTWLSLKGRFNEEGKLGIDLLMAMDVNVVSGIDKASKRPIVNIYSDNPYIKTIGIASYKTDVQPPKKFGLGISAGYGVCRSGLSPFVGIGVNYNLIRF